MIWKINKRIDDKYVWEIFLKKERDSRIGVSGVVKVYDSIIFGNPIFWASH